MLISYVYVCHIHLLTYLYVYIIVHEKVHLIEILDADNEYSYWCLLSILSDDLLIWIIPKKMSTRWKENMLV